jgi:hypothetical protein
MTVTWASNNLSTLVHLHSDWYFGRRQTVFSMTPLCNIVIKVEAYRALRRATTARAFVSTASRHRDVSDAEVAIATESSKPTIPTVTEGVIAPNRISKGASSIPRSIYIPAAGLRPNSSLQGRHTLRHQRPAPKPQQPRTRLGSPEASVQQMHY